MADRIMTRPKGVRVTSPWPYAEMPKKAMPRRRTGDAWVLAISTDPALNGLVTYYPISEGPQRVYIPWEYRELLMKPFYRVDSKEKAERFAVTFCSRGYDTMKEELPHQEGTLWGFNWSSLTNATVAIASQVADHLFNDRWDEAWAVGRKFGEQIREAENALYTAAK